MCLCESLSVLLLKLTDTLETVCYLVMKILVDLFLQKTHTGISV